MEDFEAFARGMRLYMEEIRKEETKTEYPSYKVVSRAGVGEYEEKKSRFIAYIEPVKTQEEALAFIERIRRKHYDAQHNCPAYIIGRNRELMRSSDDGEPSGTAGKPILEVLMGEELTDVAVVVTRYFGGTLLGTGGLVRAYTQAVKAGLADAGTAVMNYMASLTLRADYTDVGKIQYLLGNKGIRITDSRYADLVEFDILTLKEAQQGLEKELLEVTAGRIKIQPAGEGYYRL